jgi:8-oxo-dGTP diphosphatase
MQPKRKRSRKQLFELTLRSSFMIRVVTGIIELQGQLLICQRRRGSVFALKWEFPGGKVRRGETPWEALTRELREELAVEARIGRQIYQVQHRYAETDEEYQLSFFLVTLLTANRTTSVSHAIHAFPPVRNRVFERIRWVRPADLQRYDFLAGDRSLVARLARSEFLNLTTA